MFSSKTDGALLMVQAKEFQWVMKEDGYLQLEAQAGVMDWAEWDLVWEETGVWLRGVANGKMGSAVVQERVLGVAAWVNLTVGCAMGDATLGDVGHTLGALGYFCGSGAGGIGGLWMGEVEGLPVCCVGVGRSCWRKVLVGQSAAVWRRG
jgi:hypothetical protein